MFLFKYPRLYEALFERDASNFCLEAFQKNLGKIPDSILDIGCGTGRDLAILSQHCSHCIGVDLTPSMIEFAREQHPNIAFEVGDMRSISLHSKFESILLLGNTLNYVLKNEDIEKSLANCKAHSVPGTLLLIEPFNAYNFLGTFNAVKTYEAKDENYTLNGEVNYQLFKEEQILMREITWELLDESGQKIQALENHPIRLIFPAELSYFLSQQGFEVLEIFEAQRSPAFGMTMYVVSIFRG